MQNCTVQLDIDLCENAKLHCTTRHWPMWECKTALYN